MKSTRKKILRTLLAFPGSTINYLAEAVGINGISIRHHLTSLEAEDLVTSSEERHGVGRPRLIYSLTEKGVEEFPTSYLRLTRRLIDSLKSNMTSEQIEALFEDIGHTIAAPYKDDLDGQKPDARMKTLASAMTKEGFIVEYTKDGKDYILTSLSCPFYAVGMNHPEVCSLDEALITDFLSTPVEKQSCIFNGEDHCTYYIRINQ